MQDFTFGIHFWKSIKQTPKKIYCYNIFDLMHKENPVSI